MASNVVVVTESEDVPKAAVDNKPTLVYWDILGLAQAIRLTLAYANADYVDVRIDAGTFGDDAYKKAWMDAKPGLGLAKGGPLAFPNLPYYIDGDEGEGVAISQSDAILRHVGRQAGLLGEVGHQQHVVDEVLDELKDFIGVLVKFFYVDGVDALKAWYESDAPAAILARWEKFLDGKDFVAGGIMPTVADFKLYVVLYNLKCVQEKVKVGSHADKEWIGEYMERIEKLPRIREYMSSPDYMKRPLNNPSAKFNN